MYHLKKKNIDINIAKKSSILGIRTVSTFPSLRRKEQKNKQSIIYVLKITHGKNGRKYALFNQQRYT